ncbi:MAG: hypothetical protein WCG93_13995 [Paludibacter sp.]
MKNLYTNQEGVKLDLATLEQAKKQLESISTFLISKGVEPDETNIKNAIDKIFDIPVNALKQVETEKIKKIIDAFGETAITDGWENKVNEKTEAFRTELFTLCPMFDQTDYLKYFIFENEISVKPEFDKQFFIDKNSVILSNSNSLNFFDKHQKACQLLNELMNHPDNEYEALNKLFYFNPESKEFELNLLQYHDIRAELEAEKKRKEGEEYNKQMRQRYEDRLNGKVEYSNILIGRIN